MRKFIEARLPQNLTQKRNARIVFKFLSLPPLLGCFWVARKIRLEDLIRILHHGSEFVAIERPAIEADTPMDEQDRTADDDRYEERHDEHQRHRENDSDRRDCEIQSSLAPTAKGAEI
ncbi:hypothetical protein EFR01_37500 [Sinorhizobium fredii]|nr:hypothetical protein EFR01_37500 [Sinorhizobium fredii]GLS06946.1 hypothetical protein GCM10007864_05720 [Sinorhizobium fredii]